MKGSPNWDCGEIEQVNSATAIWTKSASQISKEEYKDLLQGLEIEQTITENADELHRKQELQKSIETAIKAVSAIF